MRMRFADVNVYQPLLVLPLLVFAIQFGFTTVIRAYVVPKLTPKQHWQYGLQVGSDSQAFQTEAVIIADRMRAGGWRELQDADFDGLNQSKVIAIVYFVAGTNNPWVVYGLNAILTACSAILLYLLLLQLELAPAAAAAASALVMCCPMVLFADSELLREPFAIPLLLVFALGMCWGLRPLGASAVRAFRRGLLGAAVAAVSVIGVSLLRPYLLLLMLIAMSVAIVGFAAIAVLWRRGGVRVVQSLAALTVLLALLGLYVRPNVARVHKYNDESLLPAGGPASSHIATLTSASGRQQVQLDQFEQNIASKTPDQITRADLLVPHWCTVQWRSTSGIPAWLDAKLEAIACARQDYQRFCDEKLLGARADRDCDMANFTDAAQAIWHLPAAAGFGLFGPFPRMWFDGFGSHGTGLRRVGYVIDGVLDYFFLAGIVLFAWRAGRQQPQVVLLVVGLLIMLTIYGMAVPTQFILARLRLAIFVPLLGIGAAGWLVTRIRRDATYR